MSKRSIRSTAIVTAVTALAVSTFYLCSAKGRVAARRYVERLCGTGGGCCAPAAPDVHGADTVTVTEAAVEALIVEAQQRLREQIARDETPLDESDATA